MSDVIIYTTEDGTTNIDLRLDNGTVWLSQLQIAELFQTTKQNISKHIQAIYDDQELDDKATVNHQLTVQKEGEREVSREITLYNLDVILAVGYRVRSVRGVQFRRYASTVLKEYLAKGFALNDERLKNLGGGSYWKELLDRIRDIRSSEKVMYRQVLELYATAIDYDPKSDESATFFKLVQNKLHYAAHGNTASEVIYLRVDSDKPFAGLTSFNALNILGPSFVGVTQLPANVSDEELLELNSVGVRAVRFNLKRGGSEEVSYLDSVARRVHELAGWHVELYIDSRELTSLYDTLAALPSVSVDHLGLSKDGFSTLLKLVERGVYVKATGFGRVDFDVRTALKNLYAANPDALMFGTDLPSTRAPRPYEDSDFALVIEALGSGKAIKVLYENAVNFYHPTMSG